jgi:hypothetical protein
MMSLTAAERIDYLNIGLMVLSFVMAVMLPFELFLFSYAVLGPLHYITEIAWLDQRNFFLKRRQDVFFLVGISFLIFLQVLMPFHIEQFFMSLNARWFGAESMMFLIWVMLISGALTVFLFVAPYIFNKVERYSTVTIWLITSFILIIVAQVFLPQSYKFLALMLPTIIHVCVFTGMFILSGALKQNNGSAYSVFVLYMILVVAFFVWDMNISFTASSYAMTHYTNSDFPAVNKALLSLFGHDLSDDLFSMGIGRNIQAFIAFVYTYHYLNWFSKTGLTGWHQVERTKLVGFALVWLGCLAVYVYDYRLGLQILFFFSFLHVVLEFPLNHKVGGQIVRDMGVRVRNMLQIQG